ncbi:hypothetical protein VHEMI00113 [[Torrubiella] hemipterigena]|uniref:AT hook domain-containing protein n=1 Tax=[Torrubiella] hemipterigena TaxID=1531966 RepID=A0A0A1T199_9HYPO|nr:hypothetical protein VHEMI00113 [[Torrubiella] hemipterigena]
MFREIADSDDDLDGDDSLPVPLNNGDWSEHATRSTGSTDPILFQQVLAEQSEAAKNVKRNATNYSKQPQNDTQDTEECGDVHYGGSDTGSLQPQQPPCDLYDVPSSPLGAVLNGTLAKPSFLVDNSFEPQATGPTPPSTNSLVVIPQRLSIEEQGQYQAYDIGSTDSYPPTAGAFTIEHEPSSVATVVNTPGKRIHQVLQITHLDVSPYVEDDGKVNRDESPHQASDTPRTRSRKSPKRGPSSSQELSPMTKDQTTTATPVKGKKRGRPSRKVQVAEDDDAVEEPVIEMPRKRRGRPKKSAKMVEEENPTDDTIVEDLTTEPEKTEADIQASGQHGEVSVRTVEALPDSEEEDDAPVFAEPDEKAVETASATSSKATNDTKPAAAVSLLKQAHRPAVLASADKPVYRIGLSKRQRMPSLLKMVPKK